MFGWRKILVLNLVKSAILRIEYSDDLIIARFTWILRQRTFETKTIEYIGIQERAELRYICKLDWDNIESAFLAGFWDEDLSGVNIDKDCFVDRRW